ncbi:MAG: peptide-methionine (S)-S-oxide reductase MsrA [Candidatus Diapherotrites archaeon]|nr:peptide-methionine (S)-S-oxide reductase MsrA [Candidatus Diapherotrites archaeon]MDZ4256192.1 peptide-methionine (S)-S-oxide reductase MsrA [archaeon]
MPGKFELATFGAGCFWGVEQSFRRVNGVVDTTVGFMGGTKAHPTYAQVCSGKTGHVEVCHLSFDPKKVSYDALLRVFWDIHDPTQGNRQGPDRGSQYRSVIFYHSQAQLATAEKSIKQEIASKKYPLPITTTIEPASVFYRAEEYHQMYLEKTGQSHCPS